jgi:hypothetical protein
MKWRCVPLKRWLPEYPDGDLSAFWRRRLAAHLPDCPACRRELEAMREVIEAVKAAPPQDPGPDFWGKFSQEMHLKLVQAAPPAPAARWFKVPYLLGAPALAVLLLWTAFHFLAPGGLPINSVQMARTKEAVPVKSPLAKSQEAPLEKPRLAKSKETAAEQLAMVAAGGELGLEEDDDELSGWDVEPVIADLTDQERELLLQRLRLKEKDGSCVTLSSFISWA